MALKPKSFNIYKWVGETPLEAITRIRAKFPDFLAEKMTYAGRLDPLAEGVLLVLVGEECKNKAEYLGWDKEYEVEFLLGVKTDTGDIMGLIESVLGKKDFSDEQIIKAVRSLIEKKKQSYPKYSSPRLCGKEDIFKDIEIKDAEFLEQDQISSPDLLKNIIKKISVVVGDFRQIEIVEGWKKLLVFDNQFTKIKCRVFCTSGTYIRVLAEELGQKLDTNACVYRLKRTRVGNVTEKDCLVF